jgi:hypothetical protein
MPQLDKKELAIAKKKAKKIGVDVKYSTRKNKKLDVYKDDKKVASIGDKRYTDFIQSGDKEKRRLYKARHAKDRKVKGSGGYYADKILW